MVNAPHASLDGPLCMASRGALLGVQGGSLPWAAGSPPLNHSTRFYTQRGNSPLIYIRDTVWEMSGAGWGCLRFHGQFCLLKHLSTAYLELCWIPSISLGVDPVCHRVSLGLCCHKSKHSGWGGHGDTTHPRGHPFFRTVRQRHVKPTASSRRINLHATSVRQTTRACNTCNRVAYKSDN